MWHTHLLVLSFFYTLQIINAIFPFYTILIIKRAPPLLTNSVVVSHNMLVFAHGVVHFFLCAMNN
jgi:hypothetical protein